MISVISPAKTLDFKTPPTTKLFSQPDFIKKAENLVRICKQMSPHDLSMLMGISNNLGALNAERFSNWHLPFTPHNAKQALMAFNGDVYIGLNASTLTDKNLNFAQNHLRILSGLYGILRPLDLIQPYRLEMGTRLKNPKGNDLYRYWGKSISENLNTTLQSNNECLLVNLASEEYFKSINLNILDATIVTPTFKDKKNGKYKVISFFSKKARGLMANFLIKEQIQDVEGLCSFSSAGYTYSEEESTPLNPVFLRDMPV